MKKARLLKLRDLLLADAANAKGVQFDLAHWAAPSDAKDHMFKEEPKKPIPVSCGTSACALGLAVISGAFKRAGLFANFEKRFDGIVMEPAIKDDRGRVLDSFDAACLLFGISQRQAFYLFAPDRYPKDKRKGAVGERYVAKRIEKLLAHDGIPPRDCHEGDNPKVYF